MIMFSLKSVASYIKHQWENCQTQSLTSTRILKQGVPEELLSDFLHCIFIMLTHVICCSFLRKCVYHTLT